MKLKMRWWVPKQDVKHNRHWVMTVGMVREERTGALLERFSNTNSWRSSEQEVGNDGYVYRSATFNFLARLPAGTYTMKIATADLDASLAGTESFRFQVPVQAAGPLLASSIVLSKTMVPIRADANENAAAAGEGGGSTNRSVDPLRWQHSRLIPAVVPVFSQKDHILLFARLYLPQGQQVDDEWQVTATLRNAAGEIIAGPFQIGLSGDGTSSGVPILHRFDLRGLGIREGRYSVELKILHRHTYWHTSYTAPLMVLKDARD
jgi:hypothetical protein